ncbi:MAG TPA: hypothetical protein PL124_07095 [Candidatus Cloacimonadota bacterium]|nr:hypothetical protein [Candidatus Cloacimonadota bacterium]HPS39163.1 hypothetical protein [Candidatus Cloacimonadota bacterium]
MNERYEQKETMSPEEKFHAIANLKDALEDNFISLGQLLSEIKRAKLYRFKGYEKFKDFIEGEYALSGSLAGKLVQSFDFFIEEMDMDEATAKEIGLDRLSMVRPLIAKAEWKEREEWIEKAGAMPTKDLRDHIKEIKKQEKNEDVDLKTVLVDQYMEKMLTWFNCSGKELQFKLALFFQDADLEHVKKVVKERQRQFEIEQHQTKE